MRDSWEAARDTQDICLEESLRRVQIDTIGRVGTVSNKAVCRLYAERVAVVR